MNTTTLTMLLAICAIASSAAAEPPKLDQSQPIRFEIFLAKPQYAADAPKKQIEQVANPPIIGGWIEGGKVTGAYGVPVSEIYGAGASPDAYSDELCPWGYWGSHNWPNHIRPPLEFRSATVKCDQAAFSGTFDLTSGTTVCQIEVSAKPGKLGYVGTYSGKFNNLPVTGTCVARPFNVPCGMVDPANALYVLETQMYKVLVEVRGGKAVRATSILSKEYQENSMRFGRYGTLVAATSLHTTDASGMTVTITDTGLKGRSAALGGTITVTPVKVDGLGYDLKPQTITLDGTIISGAGKVQSTVKNGKVTYARSWPLTDPYAGGCLDLLKGLYRGVTVLPTELARRAQFDAKQLDALPPPSELARYMHRTYSRDRGHAFIRPPWLDFEAVAGAVKYRYELVGKRDPGKTYEFEDASPHASVRPLCDAIPETGGDAGFRLTALDASGQPLGKPQERGIRLRAAFGSILPKVPEVADFRSAMLRQPYHYVERYNSYLFLVDAVDAEGIECVKYSTPCAGTVEQDLARATTDPAMRERYLANMRSHHRQWLKFGLGYFKLPYGGMVQTPLQTAGYYCRSLLDGIELEDNPSALERLQLWCRYFARLQQPSGSWTYTLSRSELDFTGGFSLWGSAWLDLNAGVWLSTLSRLRSFEPDPVNRAQYRAMEEKAAAWFMHNPMRTGCGEYLVGQTDGNWSFSEVALKRYLDYVLTPNAPPLQNDLVMASDLLRYLEDIGITWGPLPGSYEGGWRRPDTQNFGMHVAMAYINWYALTGDPLALAKSETLATGYCLTRDPVMGSYDNTYSRWDSEKEEPGIAVRWLEQYEKVRKNPPTAIPDRHLSVTLARAIEETDRIVLDLEFAGGRMVKALARTPTWDGPGLNHTQPGRLHTRSGKALYHTVDAKGLILDKDALSGEVAFALQPPQGGAPLQLRLKIAADRTAPRLWQGRWQMDKQQGAVTGVTVADAVISNPAQISVKIQEALGGGEAWQTWAFAGMMLNKDGTATGSALVNPNAGWTAQVTAPSLKLDQNGMTLALNVEVTWHGVATYDLLNQSAGKYKTTPEAKEALLPNWVVPQKDFTNPYKRAGDITGDLIYTTTWKQVTAGAYKLELQGQRLGNMFYGAAEITAPDGKKATRQFLGDVESVGKP